MPLKPYIPQKKGVAMKVKTFVVGLMNGGIDGSFERLDQLVQSELGPKIKIYRLKDTYYSEKQAPRNSPRVVRVVVYDD